MESRPPATSPAAPPSRAWAGWSRPRLSWASCGRCSAIPFFATWNGRAGGWRPWSGYEVAATRVDRLEVPRQEPDALLVLPADDDRHAGPDRHDRLLHVPGRPEAGHALLRLARRGCLRDLVGDA